MISRAQEPEQLYAKGGIASIRQPYFLGKIVKKITKPIKKIAKSPLGKAALLGGGLWGLNKWGPLAGKISPMFSGGWKKFRGMDLGKQALLGAGILGTTLPFMAGDEEEEVIEEGFDVTPSTIANLRDQARNYYRTAVPDYIGSPFMIDKQFVKPDFYAAKGGRAGIANGGGAAEAQAEQMLRMEYQKYRNQGGTMSYQQFKMQVLKQAQQRGPMAQAQPQMMSKGGRSGYRFGEIVEDQESMVMTPQGDEVVTDQMEEIEGDTAGPSWWWKRVETLEYLGYSSEDAARIAADDNLYFEIVGDLSKLEGPILPSSEDPVNPFTPRPIGPVLPDREMAASGGRVGLLGGGVPRSHVAGYTTPAGYNRFDYPTGGVRVAAANGGIMPLLDLKGKEKDYRQDGGFVGIGKKERADDVPARLSKNEFVFTADAVRNAGGGDVDAGAEVMDNMMKHLEAGGQISEESQGLGAQGMYDNMRQLETRMG